MNRQKNQLEIPLLFIFIFLTQYIIIFIITSWVSIHMYYSFHFSSDMLAATKGFSTRAALYALTAYGSLQKVR